MKLWKLSFIFSVGTFLLVSGLQAQELNCRVIINADAVQITDKRVFRDMEEAFARFLNERKWTNIEYQMEERINCNLMLTFQNTPGATSGRFIASAQIQSFRPVFGSSYESFVFNFGDRDWEIEYVESQPIEYSEANFLSNIASMLSFYAYIIIGLDNDTFSSMGGDPYFEKAQNIMLYSQQSGFKGWQQFDSSRNRYWLIENLLSPQMRPIREGLYTYHRQGLDTFIEKPDESRKNILEVVKEIRKITTIRPNAILTISFMDAKSSEMAKIFEQGEMGVRREAFNLLNEIAPSKRDEFSNIIR